MNKNEFKQIKKIWMVPETNEHNMKSTNHNSLCETQ